MKKELQLTNNQLPDDLMDEILTMNRVDSIDSKRPSISQSDSELEGKSTLEFLLDSLVILIISYFLFSSR